ncbi:MAG: MFS transporter [bacterium]
MRKSGKSPVFTQQEKQSIYGLSGILFFRMCGLFLLLPIFSVLAQELDSATPALIGLAFGAYGLAQALLQIPMGSWSDRIGRNPVIALGLLLFIAGSLLGAVAEDVYLMIIARLLQGSGAISSAIFALIADLTRSEVRTRANAGLGASIGLAFGIAFVVAPPLAEWLGLSGIFWLMAMMGVASLIILFSALPNPDSAVAPSPLTLREGLVQVWGISALRTIDWGAFVCSVGLSSMFFLIPLKLVQLGWERGELWQIYLPMLVAGALTMIPAAIVAETRNRFREVMLAGNLLLLGSLAALGWFWEDPQSPGVIAAMLLFFMGFNVFEPLFPSLVTKMTSPETKGTASGVYNLSQFMGHFVGAALAGALYQSHFAWLLISLAALELLFLYGTFVFPNPQRHAFKAQPEPLTG